MKHFSLIQLFTLTIALLSFVSVGWAQNDGSSNSDSKASPSPTVTSDTHQTQTPTATPDTASKDTSQDMTTDGSSHSGNTSDQPTATENSGSDEPSSSVDLTGQVGRIIVATPDVTLIGTPMFVIDEKVELYWKYDNNTDHPPKNVGICYKAPPGSQGTNPTDKCDYVIGNFSGSAKKAIWDTKTKHRPGYSLGSGTGYFFIIYDADFGPGNYFPGTGRVIPSSFPFTMYNSRYSQTNQGVPKGYNPSSALRSVAVNLSTLALAVTVTIILLAI